VHQQGPILHPSQHTFFSRLPYRRLIAARGLFMGLLHWRPVPRFAMRRSGTVLAAAPYANRSPMPDRQNADRSIRVWFRLIRLEARMQAAVGERLREIGVSIPQCDVLTTLTEREGVSQQELATRLYVTKGNISGLIDRLAEAGLVERRSTANDRRQHAIYLTEAGRRMAETAIAVQHRWIASTLGRMSESDLEALEAKLVALRDIVREAEPPEPAASAKG
jgi:MarR family transcriptional regulator, organic hydroperoxide resistance regulator